MYMANAKILRLVPNTTFIPLTRVGGYTKRYQHVGIFALGEAKVLYFALGDAKVPKANGLVLQWNIGLRI